MKTVLWVAGGGRGVGAAVARRAAADGAAVAVAYLQDDNSAERLHRDIQETGSECLVRRCDLRDPAATSEMAAQIFERFGSLNYLVNSAHSPLTETNIDEMAWDELHAQCLGTVATAHHATLAAMPFLLRSAEPAIMNLSSATVGRTPCSFPARTIAKAALEELSAIWGARLAGHGIRVNVLSLGWTATAQVTNISAQTLEAARQRIPTGRMATAEEVADFVWALLDRHRYVASSVIPLDGGFR